MTLDQIFVEHIRIADKYSGFWARALAGYDLPRPNYVADTFANFSAFLH
jgi:hypothetical protein